MGLSRPRRWRRRRGGWWRSSPPLLPSGPWYSTGADRPPAFPGIVCSFSRLNVAHCDGPGLVVGARARCGRRDRPAGGCAADCCCSCGAFSIWSPRLVSAWSSALPSTASLCSPSPLFGIIWSRSAPDAPGTGDRFHQTHHLLRVQPRACQHLRELVQLERRRPGRRGVPAADYAAGQPDSTHAVGCRWRQLRAAAAAF